MKIKIENKKYRAMIITVIIVLLVSIGIFFMISAMNQNRSNIDNSSTPQRSESDIDQSEAIEENPDNKENTVNTDTPAPTTTNETSGKDVIQMVASVEVSDNGVYIRGGINNSVVYDGLCYAQLTGPNGESIKKETSLLQNPATTDCKTIILDTNELAVGRWKFTLNYTSSKLEGATDEITFDIR